MNVVNWFCALHLTLARVGCIKIWTFLGILHHSLGILVNVVDSTHKCLLHHYELSYCLVEQKVVMELANDPKLVYHCGVTPSRLPVGYSTHCSFSLEIVLLTNLTLNCIFSFAPGIGGK